MNKIPFIGLILFLISCSEVKKEVKTIPLVMYSGAMKNVMKKGELQGTIALDTLPDNPNLYGIGPVEFLQGEITLFEGRNFVSYVESEMKHIVSETFSVKAPFFVYAEVKEWEEIPVPETVEDLKTLEEFLNKLEKRDTLPFVFKIETNIKSAVFHVVNLPTGTQVSSPEDAHKGKISYTITNENVDLIGFYSTHHHTIFTHHDSNIHVHLLSKDKKQMGHLDEANFYPSTIKLFKSKS